MTVEKAKLNNEPRGSLSLFPDLWMKPEEDKQWSRLKAKETIKAERVDGFTEEERLAYRLGVDEGLWFVAVPALEAQATSKDESLKALEAAVEAQIEIGEKFLEDNSYTAGSLEAYRYVLKLIAEAKEQGEPKETRDDEFQCKYCGKSVPVIEWATYNKAHAKCQGAKPIPPQEAAEDTAKTTTTNK